jgi:hypothetical protein
VCGVASKKKSARRVALASIKAVAELGNFWDKLDSAMKAPRPPASITTAEFAERYRYTPDQSRKKLQAMEGSGLLVKSFVYIDGKKTLVYSPK